MKMKKKLLGTVANLIEAGHDLEQEPVIFKWSYAEEPYIEFQLLIKETQQANLPDSEPLH